ncbi:hypothetical protein SUGI_0777210 [Cryptomeria japonica]|nr:hypothetical protein SUGI_0777210 [Cryptomeria japonica]
MQQKSGWKIPFLSDIQLAKGVESALKIVFGTENVKVRDSVLSSFRKMEPLLDIGKFEKSPNLEGNLQNTQSFESMSTESFLNGKAEIHNEYEIETGDTFLQSVGDAGFCCDHFTHRPITNGDPLSFACFLFVFAFVFRILSVS